MNGPLGPLSSVMALAAPVGLAKGLVARTHVRTLIPQVLELMSTGRLDPALVTTHLGRIDDAPASISHHVLRGQATKTVLVA